MQASSNWLKLQKKQNKNSKKIGTVKIRTPMTKMALPEKSTKSTKTFTTREKEVGKYIAIDCEFVGVGPDGRESELARVSIVNFFGNVIYDSFVKPRSTVTDWRTWVSGVSKSDMKNAVTFFEAQKVVADLIKGKVLIGHDVQNDLSCLLLDHPRSMTRDTSNFPPFKKLGKGKKIALKKLAMLLLGKDIQNGQHSSIEDATITMELYKKEKKEFERLYNLGRKGKQT
ncbi:putative 3'-5' exonuclease [Martiniozyma asiatica (nom. inval.)]|nr:putative 3'-5' exonuclease [Martiniozyma asiatica]